MSQVTLPIIFGSIAFILLSFKLLGITEFLGISFCKACNTTTPYFNILAAAYFSGFLTCILCFPSYPSRPVKYAGLVWSIGLAIVLTYLNPNWCFICLAAHSCHIAMWIFWQPREHQFEEMIGMKVSIVFASSVATIGLLAILNLSFLIYESQEKNPSTYRIKTKKVINPTELKIVEKILFSSKKISNYRAVILNFVSPNCLYCKEQILVLDALAKEFRDKGFRFINVSEQVMPELQALGPHLEWAEDLHESLQSLFEVTGFPTTILFDSKGIVIEAANGVSSAFDKALEYQLNFLSS